MLLASENNNISEINKNKRPLFNLYMNLQRNRDFLLSKKKTAYFHRSVLGLQNPVAGISGVFGLLRKVRLSLPAKGAVVVVNVKRSYSFRDKKRFLSIIRKDLFLWRKGWDTSFLKAVARRNGRLILITSAPVWDRLRIAKWGSIMNIPVLDLVPALTRISRFKRSERLVAHVKSKRLSYLCRRFLGSLLQSRSPIGTEFWSSLRRVFRRRRFVSFRGLRIFALRKKLRKLFSYRERTLKKRKLFYHRPKFSL